MSSPRIEWKKNKNPDVILAEIDKNRTRLPDGRTSFVGFTHEEHMHVIASMLNFPDRANYSNKGALLWTALGKVSGPLNKDNFIAAVRDSLDVQRSQREFPFTLVGNLSLQSKQFPRSVRLLGATVNFYPRGLPRRFNSRKSLISSFNHLEIPDTPETYTYFAVSVKEKTSFSAAQRAMEYMDALRGLMLLRVNFEMEYSIGEEFSFTPINRIRGGGRYTIHDSTGNLAENRIWFEPTFRARNNFEINDGMTFFRSINRDIRAIEGIKNTKFRDTLVGALSRYARAFDEPGHNTGFLKLWAGLESLLSSSQADHDRIVNGCCFLKGGSEYHRQILTHLRDYRNRSVHEGIDGSDGRTNCYFLQQYFRTLIYFYIYNSKTFDTLNEANSFLDLPSSAEALRNDLKLRRKALRFLKGSD